MADKVSIGGGKVWLFREGANQRLIISAHGRAPKNRATFNCPGAGFTANVIKTSVHGLCTSSQVYDIVNFKNKKGPFGNEGNVWQNNPMSGKQTNWLLSKFAETDGPAKYNDGDYCDTYAGYLAVAEHEGFDIASPRNRWFMPNNEVNVSSVLSAIPAKQKYNEIWFSFCSFVKEGWGTTPNV